MYPDLIEEPLLSATSTVVLTRRRHVWFGLQNRTQAKYPLTITPFIRRTVQWISILLGLLVLSAVCIGIYRQRPINHTPVLFTVIGLVFIWFGLLVFAGNRAYIRCALGGLATARSKVYLGSIRGPYATVCHDGAPDIEVSELMRARVRRHGKVETWDVYFVYATVGGYSTILQARRSAKLSRFHVSGV